MNVLNFDRTEKLAENLEELYQEQEKLWMQMVEVEEKIIQKTLQFDEHFRKYIESRNYENIPRHLCSYSAILVPIFRENEIIYFLEGKEIELHP